MDLQPGSTAASMVSRNAQKMSESLRGIVSEHLARADVQCSDQLRDAMTLVFEFSASRTSGSGGLVFGDAIFGLDPGL